MENNRKNNTPRTSENKISVDELLRRRKARNEGNKEIVRKNIQNRNKQIADRHETNIENNLLGEAQIDLQMRLLDAEDRAILRFNDEYESRTAKIIEANDAKADELALSINSAVDVEYQLLEETEYSALPPRQNRFSNILFGEAEEIKSLPPQETEPKTSNTPNKYQVKLPD
jgi:hypothetical protein